MISVQFSGRLGNLLFQIASTIAYAMELDQAFKFESSPLIAWQNTLLKELSPFIVETYEPCATTYNETTATQLLVDRPYLEEPAQLVGFFQDYRIFDKWRSTILGITGLSRRRREVLSSRKFDLQPPEPNVSLHIRRGDYSEARCYHLLLNEYYYRNAVLNVLSRRGSESAVRFIIFCEPGAHSDAKKIVESLKSTTDSLGYRTEYSFFENLCSNNQPLEDWEELLAMSGCDHHIIANSTFSWWAAYLNPSHNKIVCYPDQWYNHQLYYLSTEGLEFPGWTKIPAWNPAESKCDCAF